MVEINSEAEWNKYIDNSIDEVNAKMPISSDNGILLHEFRKQEGRNVFRLVPIALDQPKSLFQEIRMHKSLGSILYNDALCTMVDRGHCVICNLVDEYLESKDPDAKAIALKLRNYYEYAYRAFSLDKELSKKGVGIFLISGKHHKSLLKEFQEKGNLTDIETGRCVNVAGDGKGMARKYHISLLDPKPVTSQEIITLFKNAKPLKDCFHYYSDEELLHALDGNAIGGCNEPEKTENEEISI